MLTSTLFSLVALATLGFATPVPVPQDSSACGSAPATGYGGGTYPSGGDSTPPATEGGGDSTPPATGTGGGGDSSGGATPYGGQGGSTGGGGDSTPDGGSSGGADGGSGVEGQVPAGTAIDQGGVQQYGGACSAQNQAVSCCNGDPATTGGQGSGLLGLGLNLGLLDAGSCTLNVLGSNCGEKVACCPTDGSGLIVIGGLCQLL